MSASRPAPPIPTELRHVVEAYLSDQPYWPGGDSTRAIIWAAIERAWAVRDFSLAGEGPQEKIRQALQVMRGPIWGWNPEAQELVVTRPEYEAVTRLLREALALLERKPE